MSDTGGDGRGGASASASASGAAKVLSQTLSRGIQILEQLSQSPTPLSTNQVADFLQVHRSIAYRLLRTLESHQIVSRDSDGRFRLSSRLATLSAGVPGNLQSFAYPELKALANQLHLTCFIGVLDQDQCVTLVSAEPDDAIASLVQKPGSRHSLLVGAPSKAILSALPPGQWPISPSADLVAQVASVREHGYATSTNEVLPGVQAIAVPLLVSGHPPAGLTVVYVESELSVQDLVLIVQKTAARLESGAISPSPR